MRGPGPAITFQLRTTAALGGDVTSSFSAMSAEKMAHSACRGSWQNRRVIVKIVYILLPRQLSNAVRLLKGDSNLVSPGYK